MQTVSSLVRLSVGFVAMAVGALLAGVLMLAVLPSRKARVYVGNGFGKTVCRFMAWLSGCPLTVIGAEHLDRSRPAIYVSNHTSVMDIFLAAWLSPYGTVGVAKKEIAWYPFFGQLYLLSGHLRIDRSDSAGARAGLAAMGEIVRANAMSIFLWPEGTRARDGRLRPFKKGLVHLAVQTGLPVVPFIVSGAYQSWEKNSLRLARVPITVTVLPAIDTSAWDVEHVDAQLESVHRLFRDVLPVDQQPQAAPAATPQAAAS